MIARSSTGWSVARFTLRTMLIVVLWLGSLWLTYRYAFNAGQEDEFSQRLSAEYVQKYYVGDLLGRYTPEQLTAKIEALSPPASWDVGGGRGSMSYFDTNQSFVIQQVGSVHDNVEDLLVELRTE